MKKTANKKPVARFVEAVTAKKYSQANKYLTKIVEHRIKQKINAQLDKPLF